MIKTLETIGGPNGSGKSTFAETALLKRKDSLYINSDSIARGLTLNGNEYAQYEAGRMMLTYIEHCLKDKRSFSFETTLSGRIWTSYIQRARKHNYKIIIYFVFANSISLCLKRIKTRVANGGHDISEKIVKRRFLKTFANFSKLYAPLADEWYMIDNTKKPVVIAEKKNGKEKIIDTIAFQKYFQ